MASGAPASGGSMQNLLTDHKISATVTAAPHFNHCHHRLLPGIFKTTSDGLAPTRIYALCLIKFLGNICYPIIDNLGDAPVHLRVFVRLWTANQTTVKLLIPRAQQIEVRGIFDSIQIQVWIFSVCPDVWNLTVLFAFRSPKYPPSVADRSRYMHTI